MLNKLNELSEKYQDNFKNSRLVMSFQEYINLIRTKPYNLTRNSPSYLYDCLNFFGISKKNDLIRFNVFDIGSERYGSIIGGEYYQTEIYKILSQFKRRGIANKLITLHGPNGSAKTSSIETIARALQLYSSTEAGAVYKFNWIFPIDKYDTIKGESGPIGFQVNKNTGIGELNTFAHLDDSQISCKIFSELNENPVFLIPMPDREQILSDWFKQAEHTPPKHLSLPGLSKKNQLIFENLLYAYDGNINKVFRHIQVERFYYSQQYRVGISTVDPQVVVDANEKLLTMDKNISNLPPILHNIRFTELSGPLVEANRGILEFSDLLKRPVEALKYLLNAVEKSSINLPTSTINLDVVFFATTNEKQLDAFKALPEFGSFSARIELITVPYLLDYKSETKIYDQEVQSIEKYKKFAPHTVELLCLWAVLTRLKQPDSEKYTAEFQPLIKKINPLLKAKLYAHQILDDGINKQEAKQLESLRTKLIQESMKSLVYEGRFGASPREVKAILNKSAQTRDLNEITPVDIFEELNLLVQNSSVYEFLQYEPRGDYHDAKKFISIIINEFNKLFESELLDSMNLVETDEYSKFLSRYIQQVVAHLKKEKFHNEISSKYEEPSEEFMKEVETIVASGEESARFRNSLLAKIASAKLENPNLDIDLLSLFDNLLLKIKNHYYKQTTVKLDQNIKNLLCVANNEHESLSKDEETETMLIFENLRRKYGYSFIAACDCLKFYVKNKNSSTL